MRDLHVHTVFSDGQNTPEELVRHALKIGMDCIGFSDHSHSPQLDGERWTMPLGRKAEYIREIDRLKKEYAGRITVLCGVEQDLYSDASPEGFDYVLGAMHFIRLPGDRFIPVDESADALRRGAEEAFGGDFYALCEAYYDQLGALPEKLPCCSIIAHFDLVTKYQETMAFFDEDHPRYTAAWKKAADKLLAMGIPFEINTGALSRGCRTSPYPSAAICNYIREKGGSFVLSSDSHRLETLCWEFDRWLTPPCRYPHIQ